MVLSSVAMRIGPLPWDFVLILLVMAVVVPWRGSSRVRMMLSRPQLTSSDRIWLYGSTIAFQWLGTGIIAWRAIARGLSPAALGLSSSRPGLAISLGFGMAAGFAMLQIISLRQMSRVPVAERGSLYQVAARLMPQNLLEVSVFVALVCTVSLCEEFMYRGFAYAVFKQLGAGSTAVAIIASSALFAAGHLYQGRRGVVNTFVLGMLLAGARSWSGSLVPAILSHLAVDLTAGLAGRDAYRGQSQTPAIMAVITK
jgi:membrane protease YdiL (CAAX protease family)